MNRGVALLSLVTLVWGTTFPVIRSTSAHLSGVEMEPVFAVIFAWFWLHESMSDRAIGGGAVVVMAVILGEWRFSRDVPARELAP